MRLINSSIIITEKPGVAKKVACALCSKSSCDENTCTYYNCDIFIHHNNKIIKNNNEHSIFTCLLKLIPKEKWRDYWKNRSIQWEDISLINSNKINKIRENLLVRSLKQVIENQKGVKKRKTLEKVEWYDINNGYLNRDWTVIHTMGNPLRLNMNFNLKGKSSRELFPNEIDNLKLIIKRKPIHSSKNSTRMRIEHIKHLLYKSIENKSQVYVATDMDVAGTFLASTLPNFKNLRIPPLRMNLVDITENGVRKAVDNAADFDWYNAEAGRLRDTIDFILGIVLNNLVIDKELFKNKQLNKFSLGRTRFLALDCVCQKWVNISESNPFGVIYFVVPNLGEVNALKEAIKNKSAIIISASMQEKPFTQAGLLRELLNSEIGTVSSRYKLIGSLVSQGLVSEYQNCLIPSPIGIIIEKFYQDTFETELFSLMDWHCKINNFIISANSLSKRNIKEIRDNVDLLLNDFLHEFLSLINSIEDKISNLNISLGKLSETNNGQIDELSYSEKEEIKGDNKFIGLEGVIPISPTDKNINSEKNLIKIKRRNIVSRVIPTVQLNIEKIVQQKLLISRQTEINLIEAINIEELIELDQITIFKSICDIKKLSKNIKIFKKRQVDIFNINYWDEEIANNTDESSQAHQPLGIFDPNPNDIVGPESFLLAKEYMRPYEHTINLIEAKNLNHSIVESFCVKKLLFKRISPFKINTAHTYDTLLATMYDLYDMPFSQTAKLAESIYLKGG